jgi:hypothetical protein
MKKNTFDNLFFFLNIKLPFFDFLIFFNTYFFIYNKYIPIAMEETIKNERNKYVFKGFFSLS